VKRREFIGLVGGAVAWPLTARAQEPQIPIVGFLNSASAAGYAPYVVAFRQGLSETGFVEGRNVAIEYRWAESDYDRLPALAADLVRQKVAVIAATGTTASILAAEAATSTIPIVFVSGTDPVKFGLVSSLGRPDGNATGVFTLDQEVVGKRLETLHEMLPTATDFGALVNPTFAFAESLSTDLQAAARTLGMRLHILRASTESDFDAVFGAITQLHVSGLLITTDSLFISLNAQLATLMLRHAIPTICQYRDFAVAGGLMSYGSSITEFYRLAGVYTGRILKGDKVANLPVQQATKVELIINLKTAKALGITVPLTLLGRADEVIE
jgi:putative tryptophan/tyrosine transport system substrate-binding protein